MDLVEFRKWLVEKMKFARGRYQLPHVEYELAQVLSKLEEVETGDEKLSGEDTVPVRAGKPVHQRVEKTLDDLREELAKDDLTYSLGLEECGIAEFNGEEVVEKYPELPEELQDVLVSWIVLANMVRDKIDQELSKWKEKCEEDKWDTTDPGVKKKLAELEEERQELLSGSTMNRNASGRLQVLTEILEKFRRSSDDS